MKLYFSPAACSLASHIALREAGLDFELVKTDIRDKKTASGEDYRTINSKGYVPALQLDDGQVLTENPAVLQYIADRKPERGLAPAAGSMERYRLQEWLGFIGSEIHKQFSPLFVPTTPEPAKQVAKDNIARRLAWTEQALGTRPFLLGETFTVADAYLFTVLGWPQFAGMDLGQWPGLKAYHARIAQRPAVQAALKAEGLIK